MSVLKNKGKVKVKLSVITTLPVLCNYLISKTYSVPKHRCIFCLPVAAWLVIRAQKKGFSLLDFVIQV